MDTRKCIANAIQKQINVINPVSMVLGTNRY